jgi:putative phosphoesterase
MRSASPRGLSLGLISDTHGLLRPEALDALRGCGHIAHAGDIGDPAVLVGLARLAPVTAVRGNNDKGAWARKLADTEILELEGTRIYLIHDVGELALDPAQAGFDVVVAGHSHRPGKKLHAGVLYVNPGSAGPRRFKLPVTVARLELPARRVLFETLYPRASSR